MDKYNADPDRTRNISTGLLRAATILFLFCVCSVAGMFFLNAIGFYGNPYEEKPDSAYRTVDINTVINERLAHPGEDAGAKYMEYVGAYGYVGGQRKSILGIIAVSVYADSSITGNYFVCGLNESEQAEGLNVGDYVYIKGQVGGNGKSSTVWDKYITLVYCYITRITPP